MAKNANKDEAIFKLSRRARILLGISVVFLLYSVIAFIWREGWKDAGGRRVFTSDKQNETVAMRVWVEPQSLEKRGVFRVWLSLENLTGERASDLQFTAVRVFHATKNEPVMTRGFESQVNQAMRDVFRQAPQASRPASANPSLGARDHLTFWATLKAPEFDGEYEVLLVYEWTRDAQGTPPASRLIQNSVLVGPLEVPGAKEHLLRVGNSLYAIWKDLALPLALVTLTFMFSQMGDHFADRRKKEESRREEASKEAERERDRVRETMARMLIVSHRDTKRYYLPWLSAANYLARAVETQKEPQETFYYLMLLLKIGEQLRDENGGFYLKSRMGEDIVYFTWGILKAGVQKRWGLADYTAAVESMESKEKYWHFQENLAQRKPMQRCREDFLKWLQENDVPFSAYVPILKIFYVTLGYEANRPLVYWYENAQKPPRAELENAAEILRLSPLRDDAEAGLLESLPQYLVEADEECNRLNSRLQDWLSPAGQVNRSG
jgi:hypothetical protein